MDKTIEQILKVFSHLARDIQNYIFSGFIILANIYMLDYFYYSNAFWKEISSLNLFIPCVIIASYILGHISLAFYTLIIESTRFDLFLYRVLFAKRFKSVNLVQDEQLLSLKIQSFAKNRDTYFHFIEREYILSNIRWNYSAAFLIASICDFIYYFRPSSCYWQILVAAVLCLTFAISLLLISVYTHKENTTQLKCMEGIEPEVLKSGN